MFTTVAMSIVAVAVAQPAPNRTFVCDRATLRCVEGQSTMGERQCWETCGRERGGFVCDTARDACVPDPRGGNATYAECEASCGYFRCDEREHRCYPSRDSNSTFRTCETGCHQATPGYRCDEATKTCSPSPDSPYNQQECTQWCSQPHMFACNTATKRCEPVATGGSDQRTCEAACH